MEITEDVVDQIAHLARLEFKGGKKEEIREGLQRIIAFVDKLKEIDTEGVEPLVYMTSEINRLREDEPKVTLTQMEALKNAPKKDSDYFRIPKVLSK